jgi:hypothetical protein
MTCGFPVAGQVSCRQESEHLFAEPRWLSGHLAHRGFTFDYSAISLVTKFPQRIIQPSLCRFHM